MRRVKTLRLKLRKHRGLCDRDCPRCRKKDAVHWKPDAVVTIQTEPLIMEETGRYYCDFCNWKSKIHTTVLECIK